MYPVNILIEPDLQGQPALRFVRLYPYGFTETCTMR